MLKRKKKLIMLSITLFLQLQKTNGSNSNINDYINNMIFVRAYTILRGSQQKLSEHLISCYS